MRKWWAFGIGGPFRFRLYKAWYDGPFWHLQIGWISIYYSRDGLPYIFQDHRDH